MIKSTRLLKRLMALILVLLLSIESFAAIVGDNDGAAFITKAEFDSLKNTFQAEINRYNSSIDNKIDGAIASYLAGVKVAKTSKLSIIPSGFGDTIAVNGSVANTFQYPDVDANIVLCHIRTNYGSTEAQIVAGSKNEDLKQIWMEGTINYKKTSVSGKRNLVSNVIIGSTPNVSNMVWAGRALATREKWTMSIVKNYEADPAYLQNEFNNAFQICQFLNITARNYITSWTNNSSPYWAPTVRWRYKDHVGGEDLYKDWGSGSCYAVSTIPTITYENDSSGNQFNWLHIINHQKTSSWEVCAKDVTNYLKTTTNNTNKTSGWTSAVTKDGKWTGYEVTVRDTEPHWIMRGFRRNASVTWTDNTSAAATNNAEIPVLGLLGSYTADKIYQYKLGDLVDSDGENVPAAKLYEGLPILKVKMDEIIEWTPVFKDISITGVSGVNECKIILSYKPFTDKGNVSSTDDYVKMDGITKGSWAVSSSKKVKIKFEADRDSYVYAKWVPNTVTSTIDGSTYWQATLDVTNCNTYYSTKN